MNKFFALLVSAALLLAGIGCAPAAHAEDGVSPTPPDKKRVEQRHKEWLRITGELKRHRRKVVHVRVKSSSSQSSGSMRTARATEEYACVVRSNRSGVVAYDPLKASGFGNSFSHRWVVFPYRFDRARSVGADPVPQQQFEMCAVGGGHTWNKWAANFVGASVTLATDRDVRIGQSWGERVADGGGVNAQLGFKLSSGFAEVSGSVPVGIDDDHKFSGTDGYDDRINLPAGWSNENRVTAFYESGHTWTFQGTDANVGNTLHSLYEFPQSGTAPVAFVVAAKLSAHCTKWWQIAGRECESLE